MNTKLIIDYLDELESSLEYISKYTIVTLQTDIIDNMQSIKKVLTIDVLESISEIRKLLTENHITTKSSGHKP